MIRHLRVKIIEGPDFIDHLLMNPPPDLERDPAYKKEAIGFFATFLKNILFAAARRYQNSLARTIALLEQFEGVAYDGRDIVYSFEEEGYSDLKAIFGIMPDSELDVPLLGNKKHKDFEVQDIKIIYTLYDESLPSIEKKV